MKYLDYKEHRKQGTFDFPIAFYHIYPQHPRYPMPYHWHTEYEIIRILSGEFHITVDGNSFTAHEDDILFIQDGVFHGGTPKNCIYECIVFDMKLLLKDNHICTRQIQNIMQHEISIHTALPNNIFALRNIVSSLFEAMGTKKTGYEFTTQGALYQLFGIILEEQLYDTVVTHKLLSAQHSLQLKNVLHYIETHYTEAISLNELAKIAGMNPKYFCRFFKEMTSRTPINYLNYYRIECACEQFSTKRTSITEVALNCGFNDISYFCKTFHKYKGVTPRQYMNVNYS